MIQSIVHVALEIRTKLLAVIQTNFTLAEDTCRPEQDKRWGPGFGRTYRAIKAAYSAAEFVPINFVIDAKQTVDFLHRGIDQRSAFVIYSILSRFFHHKICKSNSLPFYLLFLYNLIASFFKKRFCCNGSMGCDGARNRLLQPIADSGRNAFSLMVGMNKQTVKVSGAVYIAKADKNILFNSNDGVMFLKRLVLFIQIHLSGCPYMQLFSGVIFRIYSVYCMIKQFRYFFAIGGAIFSKRHIFSPDIKISAIAQASSSTK